MSTTANVSSQLTISRINRSSILGVRRISQIASQRVSHYLVLSVISIFALYPFWWTLITALSSTGDIYRFPPPLWPSAMTLDNFVEVFRTISLITYFENSILIATATVAGSLIVCSLAAYPLARMKFAGRKWIFGAIIATLILPAEVNFLVNFITISKLHLNDSVTGVVLPSLAGALGIFLMKQAFEAVPQDLVDAARLDGATEVQIFRHVMLPLAKPALAALSILTLVAAWNQYIWPSVVMTSPDKFPLSVGVLYLSGAFGYKTRVVAAGAVLTVLPILAIFVMTQRFFIRGFEGAVK